MFILTFWIFTRLKFKVMYFNRKIKFHKQYKMSWNKIVKWSYIFKLSLYVDEPKLYRMKCTSIYMVIFKFTFVPLKIFYQSYNCVNKVFTTRCWSFYFFILVNHLRLKSWKYHSSYCAPLPLCLLSCVYAPFSKACIDCICFLLMSHALNTCDYTRMGYTRVYILTTTKLSF